MDEAPELASDIFPLPLRPGRGSLADQDGEDGSLFQIFDGARMLIAAATVAATWTP
jgi:hypothetical protein